MVKNTSNFFVCVEKTLTFFLYGNFLCVRILVIFCMCALHNNFLYGKKYIVKNVWQFFCVCTT